MVVSHNKRSRLQICFQILDFSFELSFWHVVFIKNLHFQEFVLPFNTYGIVFDGMNTIFSAKKLKLVKPISGNFDIVEDPNIDPNRTIPVKYTLQKRSEGTPYFTEVRFASFLSGGFITAIVVNSPERNMAKRTSVYLFLIIR